MKWYVPVLIWAAIEVALMWKLICAYITCAIVDMALKMKHVYYCEPWVWLMSTIVAYDIA